NTSVTFDDQSFANPGATITSRTWNWDDPGQPDGTGTNPTHSFASPGHYTVIETVTDSNNAVDKFAKTITVGPEQRAPEVLLDSAATGRRRGQAINFFSDVCGPDAPTAPVSYTWDFGDGATSTSANPSHTYSSAGPMLVILTVTDSDNLPTKAAVVILVHAS